MSDSTRRGFLVMAGAGAAAVGVGVSAEAVAPAHGAGRGGPLVAYVRDARRGEVSLMVGEHEVVVHDPELVNRLLRASGV